MRSRAEKEAAILWCLRREPGMFATDVCAITGVWRGSIYIYLAAMEDRGQVRSVRPEGKYPQRYRYYAISTDQSTGDRNG